MTAGLLPGADRLAIGVLGSNPGSIRDAICDLPGVVDAIPVSKPYKQVTREWHPEPTVVDVSGVRFGDGSLVVIAGPCAVESREQVLATARDVADAGATMFRGGAFKPRSSPYRNAFAAATASPAAIALSALAMYLRAWTACAISPRHGKRPACRW